MTETQLLERCCQDPEAHLAVAELSHFDAYLFGYRCVAEVNVEKFDHPELDQRIKNDYRLSDDWPYNVAGKHFLSYVEGERKGMEVYLKYRKKLAILTDERPTKISFPGGLREMLASSSNLRKRPAMFFGNQADSGIFWSCISGAQWAERDVSNPLNDTGWASQFMVEFQLWMEKRFPFSKDIRWWRTMRFVSLESQDRSLQMFFELFDRFDVGAPPDSLSLAGQMILQNIEESYGASPLEWTERIRRITPG